MKNALKIGLTVIAAAALVGCASTKPAASSGAAGSGNGSENGSAATTTPVMTPAQMLSQTLATMPSVIYFGFDKYSLSPTAISVLQQNAAVLLKNPQLNIMLAGNTDPLGSQEYNFHLGAKRAKAVYDYLLQQGVPASQMCMVSYGELRLSPEVDQAAISAAKGSLQALISAYAPDRRTEINYNQTCQGANASMGN